MGRAVTRVWDADVPHCSSMVRAEHSDDTVVNDLGVSLRGHRNTSHLFPSGIICPSHAAGITVGSLETMVNDVGLGRVGDAITGCTMVAEGSPDTVAG